ncbi:MAG: glycine cleavage system protein H [Candidatus Altiarchaeales archaeon]|nr:MAG: glycine cleavage system protein H [Candidatus Altiarchaeales archaeon]
MKIEEFEFPDDLLYTKEHLWVKIEDGKARVGFTDLGQAFYKGIMHIDLPSVGEKFRLGDEISTFETIKSVSKINSPLSGKITRINENLKDNPEIINEDPYGKGWLFEIKMESPEEKEQLMGIEKAAPLFKEIIKREKERYAYLYE